MAEIEYKDGDEVVITPIVNEYLGAGKQSLAGQIVKIERTSYGDIYVKLPGSTNDIRIIGNRVILGKNTPDVIAKRDKLAEKQKKFNEEIGSKPGFVVDIGKNNEYYLSMRNYMLVCHLINNSKDRKVFVNGEFLKLSEGRFISKFGNAQTLLWNTDYYTQAYIDVRNSLLQVTEEEYKKFLPMLSVEEEVKITNAEEYYNKYLGLGGVTEKYKKYNLSIHYNIYQLLNTTKLKSITFEYFPLIEEFIKNNIPSHWSGFYREVKSYYEKELSTIEFNELRIEKNRVTTEDGVVKISSKYLDFLKSKYYLDGNNFEIVSDNPFALLCKEGKGTQPIFFKIEDEKELNFFGCEIEYHRAGTANKLLTQLKEDDDIRGSMYFMSDGSLHHGLETATHPFTKGYYLKKGRYSLEKFIKLMKKGGAESDSGSGLHIHISRSIGKENIDKVWDLVNNNKAIFQLIAGRGDSQWCKFGKKTTSDRYCAVNLCPQKTIEIRIFRSDLDSNILLGKIETIIGLVDYVNSVKEIKVEEFLEFMKTNKELELGNLYINKLFPKTEEAIKIKEVNIEDERIDRYNRDYDEYHNEDDDEDDDF